MARKSTVQKGTERGRGISSAFF